jgi:hypothetical protein
MDEGSVGDSTEAGRHIQYSTSFVVSKIVHSWGIKASVFPMKHARNMKGLKVRKSSYPAFPANTTLAIAMFKPHLHHLSKPSS